MGRTRRWRREPVTPEADEAPGTTVATAVGPPDPPGEDADDVGNDTGKDTGNDTGDDEPDGPFRVGDLTPLLLLRAAHLRQAVLTSVAMAVAAALSGRAGREVVLVLATVLVGQVILGWFNDLVDRRRDAKHQLPGKPIADGRLDPGTVWFCLAVGVFLVVPLAVGNGVNAGSAYLLSLLIGLIGNWTWLRKGFFSWLPWAASFALYPAFLSYGGWGGQYDGAPPELLMTVLAALLGIGVHLLVALWGLVPDNADGWTCLPLRIGLRLGASRLLWVTSAYLALVVVGIAFAATYQGLSQSPL